MNVAVDPGPDAAADEGPAGGVQGGQAQARDGLERQVHCAGARWVTHIIGYIYLYIIIIIT